jgi:uncharacterized protein (DUF58 family)
MNPTTADRLTKADSPLWVSTQATGSFLTLRGLLSFTAILCLAVWFGQEEIAVLTSLILASALISRGWSMFSLAGVSAQFLFGERRAFPGDVINGRFRIINRKPLPLTWIEVEQQLPKGLAPTVLQHFDGEGKLRYTASIRWYQALHWTVGLTCTRRGYYPFPSLSMTSGDPFGFYSRSAVMTPDDPVLVYPRLIPLGEIGIPCIYPMGDERTESRLFPDPTRIIGVRDYRPQDPLRFIHWKASARQRKLQVKVFEAATTRKIALFVAADSFETGGNAPDNDFEFALSVAASMAHDAIGRKAAVGLFMNARLAASRQPAAIGPSGGHGSLMAILETLAKATPMPSGPFTAFARSQIRTLSQGTTIMLVYSRPPEALLALVDGFRQAGYSLIILQIGGDDLETLPPQIPRYRIHRPAAADAVGGLSETVGRVGSSEHRIETGAGGGDGPR